MGESDTVRVFISSTFRDMHAERDHLNRWVFPELRDRCRRRGIRFVAVDLRWGVTQAEAESGAVLTRCLEEIKNCGFFVGLVGERYGWVPPPPAPETIPAYIFRDVFDHGALAAQARDVLAKCYEPDVPEDTRCFRIRESAARLPTVIGRLASFWRAKAYYSITAQEILQAIVAPGNALTFASFYLRQLPKPGPEVPAELEQKLRTVFQEQEPKCSVAAASLTHRIRGLGASGRLTVHTYDVAFDGLRIDPCFLPESLSPQDVQALADGVIGFPEWEHLSPALRHAANVPVGPADAAGFGTVALKGLDRFGELVMEDLSRGIDLWLEAQIRPVSALQLSDERPLAATGAHLFVGRERELAAMHGYVSDLENHAPFVILGPAGCGKTALMARFVRELADRHTEAILIDHFVGASPGSSDLGHTLRYLCRKLCRECALDEPIPDDPQKLRHLLLRLLDMVPERCRVVLVIDALNQLDPAGRSHDADWFPFRLPGHVKVIVSAVEESGWAQRLEDGLALAGTAAAVQNVMQVGVLAEDQAALLAQTHLMDMGKKLETGQMQALLSKQEVRLPLYLLVALEELCLFGLYEHVLKRIDLLPPTLAELFEQVLARLEHDFHRNFTELAMRLLAGSRYGLSEEELLDLLRRNGHPDTHGKWRRFYYSVRLYLRPAEETGAERREDSEGPKGLSAGFPGETLLKKGCPPEPLPKTFGISGHSDHPIGSCEVRHQLSSPGVTLHDHGGLEERLTLEKQESRARSAKECPAATSGSRSMPKVFGDGGPGEGTFFKKSLPPEIPIHIRRLLNFFHEQLRVAVFRRYFGMDSPHAEPTIEYRQTQAVLAEYFHSTARQGDPPAWQPDRTRGLSELVYHQVRAADRLDPTDPLWESVAATLCDLGFIAAKCAGSMVYDLVSDYAAALDAFPDVWAERSKQPDYDLIISDYVRGVLAHASDDHLPVPVIESVNPRTDQDLQEDSERIIRDLAPVDRVRAFARFVKAEADVLAAFGSVEGFCVQHAYNAARSGPVAEAAASAVKRDSRTPFLLRDPRSRPEFSAHPALVNTLGHHSWVTSVSVSPDGRRVLSGTYDRTVRLWDLETGECLRTLRGHGDMVSTVSMTLDGKRAVSASHDRTIRLWDLESGQCIRTVTSPVELGTLSITPDGRRAVSGSGGGVLVITPDMDCTLRVWDLDTGECTAVLEGHSRPVPTVSLNANGRIAVSGSRDGTVRVWDLDAGRCLTVMTGTATNVASAALTPDGTAAVSAGEDRSVFGNWRSIIEVWDCKAGRSVRSIESRFGAVTHVSLTADGKRAVSGSDDGIVRLWDLESGVCLKTFSAHTDAVKSVAVTPDGRRAVSSSGDRDGTLRVWDLEAGRSLDTARGDAGVYLTPDRYAGRTAAAIRTRSRPGRTVAGQQACDVREPEIRGEPEAGAHTQQIESASVQSLPDPSASGESSLVAVAEVTSCSTYFGTGSRGIARGEGNHLDVWDMQSGTRLRTLDGLDEPMWSLAVTPDLKRVVAGDEYSNIHQWHLETGEWISALPGQRNSLHDMSLSPDGKCILASSGNNTLRLWDLETGECLRTYQARSGAYLPLAVTPDFATGLAGRTEDALDQPAEGRSWSIDVWDLTTAECLKTLVGHTGEVKTLAVSPAGTTAVSGSADATIRVWNIETGECLGVLRGHTDYVVDVNVTHDGTRVVSRSLDRTIRLWDMATGACLAVYPHEEASVSRLGKSEDWPAVFRSRDGFLFPEMPNLLAEPPLVTAERMWRYGDSGESGSWDDGITFRCPLCGQRSPMADEILVAVEGIAKEMNLAEWRFLRTVLPAAESETSELTGCCLACGEVLRFNPFVVDNRDLDEQAYAAQVMETRAASLEAEGKLHEAADLRLKSWDVRRRQLGSDHPETLRTETRLAALEANLGNEYVRDHLAKAGDQAASLRRLLSFRDKALGTDHRRSLHTAKELARILLGENDFVEGARMLRRSVEGAIAIMGPETPESAKAMFTLARTLVKAGEYGDAGAYYGRAMDVFGRVGQRPVVEQIGREIAELYKSANGKPPDVRLWPELAAIVNAAGCGESAERVRAFLKRRP
ncbi:MAG: AAA family ATPase [Thermodesulfobacteriota bacterium]